MARFLSYIFPAGNTQDLYLTQNVGAASNLTLNGNLIDKTTNTLNFLKYGYSRQVSCTTTQANNVVFTITGSQNGVNITETVTANNNTVYSTNIYDSIDSISINRDATGVSVGTGWSGFFPLIGVNLEQDIINYTLTIVGATAGVGPQFAIYGSLSTLINNGSTYPNIITTDNVVSIRALGAYASNYVYSNVGNPTYSNLLVKIGQSSATLANSLKLNFIQI